MTKLLSIYTGVRDHPDAEAKSSRSALDQINFEGVSKDKICEIRDFGFVAPAFQPWTAHSQPHAGSIVSGYSCGQGNFRLGGRLTCGLVVAGGCGEIYPPVNRMVQAVLPPDTVPFESADAKGGHCVCRVLEVREDVD